MESESKILISNNGLNRLKRKFIENEGVICPETYCGETIEPVIENIQNNMPIKDRRDLFSISSPILQQKLMKQLRKVQELDIDKCPIGIGLPECKNNTNQQLLNMLSSFSLTHSEKYENSVDHIDQVVQSEISNTNGQSFCSGFSEINKSMKSSDNLLNGIISQENLRNNENLPDLSVASGVNNNCDVQSNKASINDKVSKESSKKSPKNLQNDIRPHYQISERSNNSTQVRQKHKFITALTKKYFDGKLFEKEKVILPEKLESGFINFAYKRLKKAAQGRFLSKKEEKNQDKAKNDTNTQNNQLELFKNRQIVTKKDFVIKKIDLLQMIDVFLIENKLCRMVLQQQKIIINSQYGINTGLICDSNPLALEISNDKARGKYHRAPSNGEYKYFRIRKGARQISSQEISRNDDDYELVLSSQLMGCDDEQINNKETQELINEIKKVNLYKDNEMYDNMLFHFRMSISSYEYNEGNYPKHDWVTNCLFNKSIFENSMVKNMFKQNYSNESPSNFNAKPGNSQYVPQFPQNFAQSPNTLPAGFGNVPGFAASQNFQNLNTKYSNTNQQNTPQYNNSNYSNQNKSSNFQQDVLGTNTQNPSNQQTKKNKPNKRNRKNKAEKNQKFVEEESQIVITKTQITIEEKIIDFKEIDNNAADENPELNPNKTNKKKKNRKKTNKNKDKMYENQFPQL